MGKYESLTNLANREARKLGIEVELRVGPSRSCGRKLRQNYTAHAHCFPEDSNFGLICVQRNGRGIRWWKSTIQHEVAHFINDGHGDKFMEVRAQQGDPWAKGEMIRKGKMRCPKHEWLAEKIVEEKLTARGLLRVMKVRCARCGKRVPERRGE